MKLIIFDMDGLMFDTEELFYKALSETALTYGYTIPRELYIQTLGTTMDYVKEVFGHVFGSDYPLQEISSATRKKVQDYLKHHEVPVKPGLYSLLDEIRRQKLLCAIASSSGKSVISQYLENTGLENVFDAIVSGDQVTHSKPEPDIFQMVCRILNVAPEDALVLEDSENGILAASRAKIPVICIPDMKYPDKEFADKTTAILSSLEEVIPFIITDGQPKLR